MKITQLLTVCLFTLPALSFSQNNWLQSAGGNANDEALSVIYDDSGHVYACGYFSQSCRFGNVVLNSSGMTDIFVSKQDSLGNYIWVVCAGGTESDRAAGIATDTSGGIFITGIYSGSSVFGSDTINSSGNSQDIFLAKLNAGGSFIWVQSFGGNDIDLASGLSCDQAGNVVVSGEFRGTSQFGSFSFTSAPYPPVMQQQAGQPSYDAIIFKTDPSGNVLWAKAGSAPYDDRAASIATDVSNNIYICGQYSDTITFSNTYYNNSFNAGFVMKMDPAGNELWFRRFVAPQFMIYDIEVFGGKVVVTGDFKNTLQVNTTPVTSITGNYTHNIFTMSFDTNGNGIWAAHQGSENILSSRALHIDNAGEVSITGYFKCTFTQFSDMYGSGLFNSAGYRDIYVIKYSGGGGFKWIRQYGGTGDDIPSAITSFVPSNPVITGMFSKTFNVPRGSSFITHLFNQDFTSQNQNGLVNHCGYNNYGRFTTALSSGNRDIFITRPVDLNRPHYDYFIRQNGGCANDSLSPRLIPQTDTIIKCDSALLVVQTRTTLDSITAPEWDILWSTGNNNDSLGVFSTGWYYVDYGYIDDCRRYRDSVYVIIYPTPSTPTISASYGIIQTAIPAYGCLEKLALMSGDTTTLTGGSFPPGYTVYWQTPWGIVNGASVSTSTPGIYLFNVSTPNGECTASKCVEIYHYNIGGGGNCTAQTMIPLIVFTNVVFETTDTVRICKNDHFEMQLVDSTLHAMGIPTYLATFSHWTISGGFSFDPMISYPYTFMDHTQNFRALSSGNSSATATVLHPITHAPLFSVTRYFYLDVHIPPPNNPVINGPNFFCPGDTVLLTASGGDNYQWSGPGIISLNSPANSQANVVMQGQYNVHSTTIDSVLGCISEANTSFVLNSIPAPSITMLPSHGVVCPMDSVLLTAEPGGNYVWYGPTGSVIATTQSVYVAVPGFYYYTYVSSSGCTLESSSSEVLEYSTPYLEYNPLSHLCENESTVITVQSNDMANIQWALPLGGNSPSQAISQGGTYSATVSFCNITTQVDIVITSSTSPAEIFIIGNDTTCYGDTVNLLGVPGMSDYNWNNGESYAQNYEATEAGAYILQTTDINGCESSDTLTLFNFNQPVPPVAGDTTICSGSTITLTAQGNGTLYWYADFNTTELLQTGDSLTVTVSQADSTFYITSSDGTCQSIVVSVTVFMDAASVNLEIFGADSICVNDTLVLFATSIPGANYSWGGPSGFSASGDTITLFPVDFSYAGFYSATVSNGVCASATDSIEIFVITASVSSFAFDSVFICQGDTLLLLSDTMQGVYTWQDGQTGSVYPATQQGNYFYMFTSNYGCSAYSDTVNVEWLPKPVLENISDTSLCTGSELVLSAEQTTGMVTWYDSVMTTIYTGDTLIINPVIQGFFVIVQVTDTSGCQSEADTVFVSITPNLPAPSISSNDTICENGLLQLFTNPVSGYSYNWSGPWNFTSSDEDPVITPVTQNQNGTYTLFLSNGNCVSDTSEIEITVSLLPDLVTSGDTGICPGTTVPVFGFSTWGQVWNTGDNSSTLFLAPQSTTTYTVSAANTCGTISENITVTVFPYPNGSAGGDITIAYGDNGQLNASGGVHYSWSPSAGLSCTTCSNPLADVEEDTQFIVTITDQNGCQVTDTVNIFILFDINVFVPNMFSPNGDGINDVLFVRGKGIEYFEFRIFDRWGEQLFETSDMNAGWDGTFRSNPLNQGVFAFTLSGRMINGTDFTKTGAITLIR